MRSRISCVLLAIAGACVCPIASAQPEAAEAEHASRDSVPAWSIGAGYGQVVLPVARLGYLGFQSAYVTLEPRIAPAWALHGEIGGGYAIQWVDGPDARRQRFGRLGLGIRRFFVTEGRVRPSALIQAVTELGRVHTEDGDYGFERAAAELAVALDGSISEPVTIRLETALLSGGYAWVHEGDLDSYAGDLDVGLSPRFEIRLAW